MKEQTAAQPQPALVADSTQDTNSAKFSPTGIEGNGIFAIPREILVAIFEYLKVSDVIHLLKTSRSLAQVAQVTSQVRQDNTFLILTFESGRYAVASVVHQMDQRNKGRGLGNRR